MGFGTKWVKWIKACLKSVMVSVLINGALTEEFPMKRGLRQGDPLAPFLFLIVTEGLKILMEGAKAQGLYEGIKVGTNDIKISHLQYANDVVFIGTTWSNIIRAGAEIDNSGIEFTKSFGKKLGNEMETSMWKERWIGQETLQESFPRLFRLEREQDTKVADRGEWIEDI